MSEKLDEREIENLEEEKKDKLNFFNRIKCVFTNPIVVMEDVDKKPQVLLPLIIVTLAFLILLSVRIDLLREFTIEQIKIGLMKNGQDIEPNEQMIRMAFVSGFIGAAIAPILIIFFKSITTHGIVRLMEGKGNFKRTFSVIVFSYFVNILGELIRTIIGLLTGRYTITTSFAVFLSDSAVNTPLYNLLNIFDVFSIWYLIVSIVGIGIVHKLSKGKATIAVLLPWAVMVGFSTIAAIFSS